MFSTTVKSANKATATTANQSVIVISGFKHISVYNSGETELRISIDGDSTSSSKIIFVGPSEGFEDAIDGVVLNYSVATGTTEFKYVLR